VPWTRRSTGPGNLPEPGHQARLTEHAHGPRLGDVEDDGLVGLATTDERDDAVGARFGALHDAVVAADHRDLVHVTLLVVTLLVVTLLVVTLLVVTLLVVTLLVAVLAAPPWGER
jgi:hypothetical protein